MNAQFGQATIRCPARSKPPLPRSGIFRDSDYSGTTSVFSTSPLNASSIARSNWLSGTESASNGSTFTVPFASASIDGA